MAAVDSDSAQNCTAESNRRRTFPFHFISTLAPYLLLLNMFIFFRCWSQTNGFDRNSPTSTLPSARLCIDYEYTILFHSLFVLFYIFFALLDGPLASTVCTQIRVLRSSRTLGRRLRGCYAPIHIGCPTSSSSWAGHRCPGYPRSGLQLHSRSLSILLQSARWYPLACQAMARCRLTCLFIFL